MCCVTPSPSLQKGGSGDGARAGRQLVGNTTTHSHTSLFSSRPLCAPRCRVLTSMALESRACAAVAPRATPRERVVGPPFTRSAPPCAPSSMSMALQASARAPTSLVAALDALPRAGKRKQTLQTAARLGLTGPLGLSGDSHLWSSPPSALASATADSLLSEHQLLSHYSTTRSNQRFDTALTRWEMFLLATPGRVAFQPLTGGAGDVQAKVYNNQTLGMFKAHCRRIPSLKRGSTGPIAADTINDYASAIRTPQGITR